MSQDLTSLLESARTIAVVGASSKVDRPSYGVMSRLLAVGYKVIPVNPAETEVLGQKAVATLLDIKEPVDIVDVFRKSQDTPQIADQAIAIGARCLWLQLGVVNAEARAKAEKAGLIYVEDLCLAVEHSLLVRKKGPLS